MSQTRFLGFPEQGIKFLYALERNNRREWFQPRKETFEEHVKAPMVALVQALNNGLAKFAPEYITDPARSIYRIYRDTRFSSDKTPYKTHIAASFWKRGLEKHAGAGLYFSVSHKEIEVAGGVYMPGPEQLLAIRGHIAAHFAEFSKLISNRRLLRLMDQLKGDQLSRVPKGFAPDHLAADLIRKKQWLYYVLLDPAMATSPKVLTEVLDRFRVMMPFIEFLNTPLKPRRLRAEDLFD